MCIRDSGTGSPFEDEGILGQTPAFEQIESLPVSSGGQVIEEIELPVPHAGNQSIIDDTDSKQAVSYTHLVLTLIFLVLKLTRLIDCKWSFIFSPLLIVFILRWLMPGIILLVAWYKWRFRK